jgi:hypothetical protein
MPLDYVIFSDTGGEKPQTYEYIAFFSEWLVQQGYPPVTVLPPYREGGLYGECVTQKRLPSIVYGFKSCSEKWKIRPFEQFCNQNKLFPANVYSGIDADETHRLGDYSDKKKTVLYPLSEWNMDRFDCVQTIIDTGLPVPPKSSCFFCPSMRKDEILALKTELPDLFQKAVFLEENSRENNTKVKGLARNNSWERIGQLSNQYAAFKKDESRVLAVRKKRKNKKAVIQPYTQPELFSPEPQKIDIPVVKSIKKNKQLILLTARAKKVVVAFLEYKTPIKQCGICHD